MEVLPWIGAVSTSQLTLGKAAVALSSFLVFSCWQAWLPFLPLRDLSRHGLRNLIVALANTSVLGLAFGTLTLLTTEETQLRQWGLLPLLPVTEPLRFVLALLVLDLWSYSWHRLNHALPWLWRFHRMHHADDRMDVTTATRFHLGELAAAAVLRLGLVPIFGFSFAQLVVYDLLLLVVTQFHHANLSLGRHDRWLSWLLVTPFMHKVHHSRWRPETDSNFASVLSLWDRLGGTYRTPNDPATIQFGLDDLQAAEWQTVAGMLWTPFHTATEPNASLHDPLRQVNAERDGGKPGEDAAQDVGERQPPVALPQEVERFQFKR